MLVKLIPKSFAQLFPNREFILQKIESGIFIAYLTDKDVDGQVTAGLPANSRFEPGVHPEFNVQVRILEGKGFFHHFGVNLPYAPGSTFQIVNGHSHGFSFVTTNTVFTKTITDYCSSELLRSRSTGITVH